MSMMKKICEISYERRKTAEWLSVLLRSGVHMGNSFFNCLRWSIGDLRGVLKKIAETAQVKLRDSAAPDASEALEEVTVALKWSDTMLTRNFKEILEEHTCLRSIARECIARECRAVASPSPDSLSYARIRRSFVKIFGVSREGAILCEFVYFNQTCSVIEEYFEDNLGIWKLTHRNTLAGMLKISPAALQESIKYLTSSGLFDAERNYFRLQGGVASLWDGTSSQDMAKLFCTPLAGQTLPLESFRVSGEVVRHVEALLSRKDNAEKEAAPVHIMLYGPPGTGKTTFARSLAKSLGVKAWSVSSRDDDDDGDRRSSLTACLYLSKKIPGSFVLVDEAERLLDTSWQAKDKAWLNSFLEQPGRRVIWITNHIEHIDPAVRRRFSFSVYFGALSKQERRCLWDQIVARHKVKNYLPESRIAMFAENYQIPAAVIEQAVNQAKELGYGKEGKEKFSGAVERVLEAHVTLCCNGKAPNPKEICEEPYTLSGVCLDGSVGGLLEKCRRADAMYVTKGSLRRGGGAMLFYGPPGTGKTALARHIAQELGRECFVRRASDLLSPWVGSSEQNVAEAFRSAEEAGAVLVIDEADTFLYSRETAQRSWESSLVNEFLTALEECKGFCICTTNRMEKMDAAAMRRFSFKVRFTYAGPEQISALYSALLAPLADGGIPRALELELRGMTRLAPGDFHTVRSQHWLTERGEISHEELVHSLKREQEIKLDREERRVGFSI